MINRRKDKRFEQEHKVNIQSTHLNETIPNDGAVEALTYNLSLSGAMILTKKTFPVESIVRTEIHLKNSKDILRVDGKVKWVREIEDEDHFAIGIEFQHEISNTVLSLIRHLYSADEGVPSSIGEP